MWRYLLLLIGLVFLVWTVATSLTQIQPGEGGVVRRFGRILDDKPGPGLYIGLPWGIDRVDVVKVGLIRTIEVGFTSKESAEEGAIPAGQMLTGDHNLVNVSAKIDYRVRIGDMENYVLQKDRIDGLVARAAESLLAEWVAGRNIDDVLLRGKIELPPFLLDRLPDRLLDYKLGIEIERASIDAQAPSQVKPAFDALADAQTTMRTKENQAHQEANDRRDKAKSETFRLERLAQTYSQEQRIQALAEADSFRKRLESYRTISAKNPDYLNALWLDEMTRLYTRMRENGRIELLDHFLTSEGLTITQFPLSPRKK